MQIAPGIEFFVYFNIAEYTVHASLRTITRQIINVRNYRVLRLKHIFLQIMSTLNTIYGGYYFWIYSDSKI